MKRIWAAGAVVAVLLAGAAALAMAAPSWRACGRCQPGGDTLLQRLLPGETREAFVSQVVGELRQADRAGDGLDTGDIDLVEKRAQAQRRAGQAARLLAYDLDGDLRVTRQELDATTPVWRGYGAYQPTRGTTEADRLMAQYDLNHDGVIDVREMVAAQPEQALFAANDMFGAGRLKRLLELGRGGRLTATELSRLAEAAFDRIDADHDGTISPAELQPLG